MFIVSIDTNKEIIMDLKKQLIEDYKELRKKYDKLEKQNKEAITILNGLINHYEDPKKNWGIKKAINKLRGDE